MKITELIVQTLQELLSEHGGTIQIQRNDLASRLGCVPSQINYVITSRFTEAQGYIVESRRGGGGFIKIVKLERSQNELILHVINSISDELDEATARIVIKSLYEDDQLDEARARLMLAVISDNNFRGLEDTSKRIIRANLFKTMLINTIGY